MTGDASFAERCRTGFGWGLMLVACGCLLGASLTADSASAQERGRPDTTQQSREPQGPEPAPFGRLPYGTAVTDSLPAREPVADLKQLLEERPGSFLYNLGAVAWPHGWSPDGLAPHRHGLWLSDLPYNDPLTGRPRYDLLPPAFLTSPRTGFDPGGQPVGVHVDWRDYPEKGPITEIRFRRDSNGLQNVEVSHSQQRRLSLLGYDGVLQATTGFKGRATAGAYDGSGLRRERGLWARVRYRTQEWIVELSDFSNRFRLGVHGGITPPVAGELESAYLLPFAADDARFPDAGQATIRNDLVARVRGPFVRGLSAGQVSAGWTSNTYDYTTDYATAFPAYPDTSWNVRTNSVHGALTQPLQAGRHHLTLSLRGTFQQRVLGTALTEADDPVWNAHALVRDSLGFGQTSVVANAGVHQTDAQTYPSARLSLHQPLGLFGLDVTAALDGQPISWMMKRGFGGFVDPLDTIPTGQVRRLDGQISVDAGVLDAAVAGFAHQITDPVDLYAGRVGGVSLGTDTVAVRTADGSFLRAGATLSAGLRREARRGIYATGHVTAQRMLNSTNSPLHQRVADTLPLLHGRGRVGARFVFFQDLITDLSIQVRGWTATDSRSFHTPTGLMAVPPPGEPIRGFPGQSVGPSYTVDVRAEMILMGAKLFFTFENVQSAQVLPQSTRPQLGTFVTPIYPLPPLQFRFGVHWPIFG